MTEKFTNWSGTKVGLLIQQCIVWLLVAQRIKITLGITGWSLPKVLINEEVWHLDVGSSPPDAAIRIKGWAVRPLKRYVSWVQNVVRQFGLYPLELLEKWKELLFVREDLGKYTSIVTVLKILILRDSCVDMYIKRL